MEAIWKIKDKLKWYMFLCLDLICAWRYFDLNYQIYCSFIRGSCSQLILSYSDLTSWNVEQVKLFMTHSVFHSFFGLNRSLHICICMSFDYSFALPKEWGGGGGWGRGRLIFDKSPKLKCCRSEIFVICSFWHMFKFVYKI